MPPNISLLRQFVLQAALRLTTLAELLGKAERGEITLAEALANVSTYLNDPRQFLANAVVEAAKP